MTMPDLDHVEQHLRRRFSRYDWRTAVLDGAGGARVHHLTGPADLHLKVAPDSAHPDSGFDLSAERDRLRWLAEAGVPAAEVVEYDALDGHSFLLTTTVPGRDGTDDWPAADRMRVVEAIADFARDLHALPADACPFDRSLRVTVPNAEAAAALGRIDLDDLDDEREGWDAPRLVAELHARYAEYGDEDLVVCHGDYCLPNVLIDPGSLTVTGIIDVGRLGLADRHADLALMHRSVAGERNDQYGAEHAERFLTRYGAPADPGRLAFYRLLDEFC